MSHPPQPSLSDWRLPVEGGHIAGIENDVRGPDVLFVHSAGYSAMTWARVIAHLPELHCVALDLRCHGHAEAPLLDAESNWRDIVTTVEGLGLDAPVLVGHDTGGFGVLCAAADRPGLAKAVVPIDCDLPFTPRVQVQADFDWAQTTEVTELIRSRFSLGRVVETEAERETLIHKLTDIYVNDWLLEGADEAIESEVRRSFVARPDGSWIHLPTVEAAVIGYKIDIDAEYYPEPALYERIAEPLRMVRYTRGLNVKPVAPYLELASRLPNMSIHDIDGGHMAHYSHAADVAGIIRATARGEVPAIRLSA